MENNQQQGGWGSQPQSQPGYGPPSQGYGYPPQGPVVPEKQMDPKTKRMIILICSIGGGVLVLGIVALIVLPIVLRVDYGATYDPARSLRSAVGELISASGCRGVVDYADSSNTTNDIYNGYVENCKQAIVDVRTHTGEVDGTSGLRDRELRELWNTYKVNYERLMPVYDELVKIYPTWREFRAADNALKKDDEWYKTATESKMEAVIRPLAESEVESFRNWAKGYKEKYIPYVMAYKQQDLARETWRNTNWNSSNYTEVWNALNAAREAQETALTAWNQWKGDNAVDLSMEVLLGVDLDSSENRLGNFFGKFYDVLNARYLESTMRDALGA